MTIPKEQIEALKREVSAKVIFARPDDDEDYYRLHGVVCATIDILFAQGHIVPDGWVAVPKIKVIEGLDTAFECKTTEQGWACHDIYDAFPETIIRRAAKAYLELQITAAQKEGE